MLQSTIFQKKKQSLERRCIYSRAKGNGSLSEYGCVCQFCKIENIKCAQWNWRSRCRVREEIKRRKKLKLYPSTPSRWMVDYVPITKHNFFEEDRLIFSGFRKVKK